MSKKPPPVKAIPPVTTVDINKANREFWEKEAERESKILKSKHGAEILAAAAKSVYMERATGMPIYNQTVFGVALNNAYLKHRGRVFLEGGRQPGSLTPRNTYIHSIAVNNPNKQAKELYKIADAKIITDMELSTFIKEVSKARNPKK